MSISVRRYETLDELKWDQFCEATLQATFFYILESFLVTMETDSMITL